MKDSWVGFGYHMAMHKENFTSVTAYYQEVFCFLVEIHFPILFATWRSVFAGVCSPRAYHPNTERIVCGAQRHQVHMMQSPEGDPRSGWQHSTSDHLLPPGVQHCLQIVLHCVFVPHQLVCVAAGQLDVSVRRTLDWLFPAPFQFSFWAQGSRPERRWASQQHFLSSLSQNHRIGWVGRNHSGSSGPIVLILKRL